MVSNSRREIAGLFVGDMVAAHRAGIRFARQVYATEMPAEPVDIAVCNAYPKDTDFLQSGMALNVLRSSPRPVLREGGTTVIISASPEGRGYHGLYGPGMCYDEPPPERKPASQQPSTIYFSPTLSTADTRGELVFHRWDDLVQYLRQRHDERATVAVFPCGSIQLAREGVG